MLLHRCHFLVASVLALFFSVVSAISGAAARRRKSAYRKGEAIPHLQAAEPQKRNRTSKRQSRKEETAPPSGRAARNLSAASNLKREKPRCHIHRIQAAKPQPDKARRTRKTDSGKPLPLLSRLSGLFLPLPPYALLFSMYHKRTKKAMSSNRGWAAGKRKRKSATAAQRILHRRRAICSATERVTWFAGRSAGSRSFAHIGRRASRAATDWGLRRSHQRPSYESAGYTSCRRRFYALRYAAGC